MASRLLLQLSLFALEFLLGEAGVEGHIGQQVKSKIGVFDQGKHAKLAYRSLLAYTADVAPPTCSIAPAISWALRVSVPRRDQASR